MDENAQMDKDLVQITRLALAGRRQDIQLYIRRMLKRYSLSNPSIADQLGFLLRESPSSLSPTREAAMAAIPVDNDSRLQLIRYEHEPIIDTEPILTDTVKASLEQIIAERSHEEVLAKEGLTPTRTVIFTGPPGVGKSLAARWIARKLSWPLLTLDLSAVMSSFLGRTGTNLRNVLDYAKSIECILLLDEIDAVAKRRDDAVEVGELKRLVTVLLQEIDDWPASGLLVAATNHPDLLDPAAWRRFEMHITFPMPNSEQMLQAVETFLGTPATRDSLPRLVIATLLAGLSFSDIERQLMQIRREAVIYGEDMDKLLERLIRVRIEALPRRDRQQIAVQLADIMPQRRVHELTGVSRDTIRNRTSKLKDG